MRARLTLFGLLFACASGPIPTGQKPIWVLAPSSDLMHPPDKFVCAVGTTNVGSKAAPELLASADAAARAAAVAAAGTQDPDLNAAAHVLAKGREGDTASAWGCRDKAKPPALQQGRVPEREAT